jgi:hypothetical protein
MTTTVKYPDIDVQLTGESDNAFAVLGAVKRAMRRHKVSAAEQVLFTEEATSGDYDHLLQTCIAWVNVK